MTENSVVFGAGPINLTAEVVASREAAIEIAAAHSSKTRYKYKAKALLVGYCALRPYHPIYLVGLTDNMTGVWVVREVTHIFNEKMPYTMEVILGSNDRLLNSSLYPIPALITDIELQVDIQEEETEVSVEETETFMDSPPAEETIVIEPSPEYEFGELTEYSVVDPGIPVYNSLTGPVNIGKCRLDVWRQV